MICPICTKEADPKYRPFCGKRCADIDLGKWFTESYSLPAEPADIDGEDSESTATAPGRLH